MGVPGDGALGSNFDYSIINNVRTFTLNTDFNTNGWTIVDIHYNNNTDQVIIDGNNKIVTIDDADFEGLFYAGNELFGNNKPTIIKNFTIKSSVNIKCALARGTGKIKFENCHLELIGNINNDGGGLVYNDDYTLCINMNFELTNCSVRVFGLIGNNGGPLIGYIAGNSGSVYTITNCYSVVADNSGGTTLGTSAGAFVGSGTSNDVTISNCFCLFNGSMSDNSGIVAGKFLGSGGDLVISKFYAVTNIVYAPQSSIDHSSYLLSCYHGGFSKYTSLSLDNINILNLGQDVSYIDCGLSSGINEYATKDVGFENFFKYTTYESFSSSANTSSNRIGNKSYYVIFSNKDNIFYIYNAFVIKNYIFNLTSNTLNYKNRGFSTSGLRSLK